MKHEPSWTVKAVQVALVKVEHSWQQPSAEPTPEYFLSRVPLSDALVTMLHVSSEVKVGVAGRPRGSSKREASICERRATHKVRGQGQNGAEEA